MTGKRVFVYVQHLLGIGHLKRAATLARALSDRGSEVTFVTGGFPVPDILPPRVHLIQLPPAGTVDLDFRSLVDAEGTPVDDAWRARRRAQLLGAWRAARPHALVIELFPFGRRQMRFELLPLLEVASSAAPRPIIVSSVRDVLGQRDPAKQDEMLALFERYFDRLLVHGDPRFLAFDRTFRNAHKLGERLHYTGFIVDRARPTGPPSTAGAGEVIVSAGGGAVGAKLLKSAIHARPFTVLAGARWRLLTGANIAPAAFEALAGLAGQEGQGAVVLERWRGDFRTLLQNSSLSVSQGGYNTVMEILDCGARAVVVPFAGGHETEQALRAHLLAERGRIEVVDEGSLAPATFAAAIDRAARGPAPGREEVNMDGARNSAELLAQWTEGLAW
ncbi:MAG TPA: glycosyltransferase [Burkholderiales bacterium]|nr:glycosyltransferase [Burkholderiales bacterium]